MSCKSCGRSIAEDARFCQHCGASQQLEVDERRVVTVLFADLVGFTALSERRDPEEVKHLVDRAFERVGRDIIAFGGVIDKIMGDGIIALFGAPIAHEDDAERAVRAGLRMQQTIGALSVELDPPIEMRIGVNTGEVLVGVAAAGGDYTAMGDVVNSAQRLQSLADPGQTLVGGATRTATGDAITYRSSGNLPAKGREEPIEAWVALGAIHPPGFHRRRGARFVGRNHELDLLEAQARLAIDNRAQLAVVVGEAGIGKTRLVEEAVSRLTDHFGATVLEGRSLPYGEANVWWPIADLIRNLFDLPLDASLPECEARLGKSLVAHIDNPSDYDIGRYSTALLHALGYDTPLRGGDRNRNRSEVMLAFTTVVEAELRHKPVVLVLSDMQWAAAAVWDLFNHVLTELVRGKLTVMMTMRPADTNKLPWGRHGLSIVQLGPLDDQASAELLTELGIDRSEFDFGELVDRSGGNPFFLEELAGLVAKHGKRAGQGDEEFDVDLDRLPATLRGTISARLDALEVGDRALLEDAAVLGRTGSIDGLLTLAEETRGTAPYDGHLMALVDNDLLEVRGSRFRFRSNLVRDVAYGRLTKTGRARRHEGIATYLEKIQGETVRNSVVVAIAEHYRAAAKLSAELSTMATLTLDRRHVVERALYWLEQAGDRALDVAEPRMAARWYDYGVELATDNEILARFVFGRSKAATEVHDLVGARADLDRLEGLPELDPELQAKAMLVRGDVARKGGNYAEATTDLAEAARRLDELGLPDQQALALRLLGMTEMVSSHDVEARRALEASRSVATASGDRRSEGWALQSLAWHAFLLGRVDEARALVEEAIEIFTEVDDQGARGWAQGVLAWVAFHTGRWEEARNLVDTILPEIQRRGDPWAEAITLNLDASLQLWSGQAESAHLLARQARAVAESIGEVTLMAMSQAVEGRALVSLGQINEGTQVLDDAFSQSDQVGDEEGRRIAVISNCASAARLGEPDRAIRWAARYDGANHDLSIVGESDLSVSVALAMLQRGALREAALQLGWTDSIEESEVIAALAEAGRFGQAVGAIVAVARGEFEWAERLTACVLSDRSTYLDRVLALLARAAARYRLDDTAGVDEALAVASTELEPTDDEPARHLVDLASAVLGRTSLEGAEAGMRSLGIDPAGWVRAFTLAAGSALGDGG